MLQKANQKKSSVLTNPFIHLCVLLAFYSRQYPGLVWLLYSLLRPLTWGATWPILLNLKFSSSILFIFGMVCLITIMPLLPKSQARVFIFWWVMAATGRQACTHNLLLIHRYFCIATYNFHSNLQHCHSF